MTLAASSLPRPSDAALIDGTRNGDREAFRGIMQRYNQRLFRVARAVVRDDNEAEDVLQESWLRAFAALERFRGEAGLATWLTAIVLNEARGRLRKRRKTVDLDAMDRSPNNILVFPGAASSANPEAALLSADARRLLERAIDDLPENFRLVFVLHEIEGNAIEEISVQLAVKPATVKTRLFRARRLLQQKLERDLSASLQTAFGFLGTRCERLTTTVLSKLP